MRFPRCYCCTTAAGSRASAAAHRQAAVCARRRDKAATHPSASLACAIRQRYPHRAARALAVPRRPTAAHAAPCADGRQLATRLKQVHDGAALLLILASSSSRVEGPDAALQSRHSCGITSCQVIRVIRHCVRDHASRCPPSPSGQGPLSSFCWVPFPSKLTARAAAC